MAYAAITKPSLHMNTKLYTGTGASNAITGVGFQPDFTWIKKRNGVENHALFDAVRGATKYLKSDEDAAQVTDTNSLSAFDSDGFTVISSGKTNTDTDTYVSWNWKANGAGSLNEVGSIDSTVSVSTVSGFSIVQYVGDGAVSATIGHGLGVKPKMFVVKSLVADDWTVYNETDGADYGMFWNNSDAKTDNVEYFNDTEPTSTVFTIGTNGRVNDIGVTYITYCFADVKGYSKFGTYTGNNSVDGSFIYTGFKPAFIIGKRTDSANNWYMFDNKRNPFNLTDNKLRVDESSDESVDPAKAIDMFSNGFKIKSTDSELNASSGIYIYMAFASEPLVANVGSSIPATAR